LLPSAGCGPRSDPKYVDTALSEILATPLLPSAGCGPRRDPKYVGTTLSEILATPYLGFILADYVQPLIPEYIATHPTTGTHVANNKVMDPRKPESVGTLL